MKPLIKLELNSATGKLQFVNNNDAKLLDRKTLAGIFLYNQTDWQPTKKDMIDELLAKRKVKFTIAVI